MDSIWQDGIDPSPVIKKGLNKVAQQIKDQTDDPKINGGWDVETRTRRVKVLWIGEQELLDCMVMALTGWNPAHRLRLKCQTLDLTNVEVVRVAHAWDRCAFGFMLYHESFEPVPEGLPAPDLDVDLRWE